MRNPTVFSVLEPSVDHVHWESVWGWMYTGKKPCGFSHCSTSYYQHVPTNEKSVNWKVLIVNFLIYIFHFLKFLGLKKYKENGKTHSCKFFLYFFSCIIFLEIRKTGKKMFILFYNIRRISDLSTVCVSWTIPSLYFFIWNQGLHFIA